MLGNVKGQGLNFYRRTFKRVRPVHAGIHWFMRNATIPVLERATGVHTIEDDPLWFRLELLTNQHEKETVQHFTRLVRPGSVVLDIGSHIGYYTRIASRLAGPDGKIIAFEPHPRTFAVLEHNVRELGNVIPVQKAVAVQAGTAELYDYLMMSASGSLHYDESMRELQRSQLSDYDIVPRKDGRFAVEKYTVQTIPLDDCLQELGIERVDVVKMDIEGAEIGALRSMRRTIQQSPHLSLIMEYNPQALKAFGHQPVEAIVEVLAMGFDNVQAIDADGSLTLLDTDRVQGLTDALMTNMGVVNLLFARKTAYNEA